MVNALPVDGYVDFKAWLAAMVKQYPSEKACAKAMGITQQLLQKWRTGSIPGRKKLTEVAANLRIDSLSLMQLAFGVVDKPAPPANSLSTRTEMGAIVGRKWEELYRTNDVAANDILQVLETMITLNRESYQRYARDQRMRQKRREGGHA